MKKVKTFEEIKTLNSSELDNWSVKYNMYKNKYTGTKKLNTNIGYKMIKVFNNYGFFITGIGPGDFLNLHKIVLEDEKNLREVRVSLGLKGTWEDFLDNEGYSEDEFEDFNEQKKNRILKEFEEQGDIINNNNLEFSVFLPNNISDENSAFADAFEYLKLVHKSIPQMYTNPTLDEPRNGGVLSELTNEFKKFINNKNIKITNNNIEDVNIVNYRLYKDSKFFWELKDVCNENNIDYKNLINDLLNIK